MILGNRVRLRAIERGDLPHFVTWLNDPEVREHLMMVQPLSMVVEEHWFENILAKPRAEHPLVIEVNINNDWIMVGNIAFFHTDTRNRCAEVGIVIGDKSYWNQGIGRDAMSLMVRHGFNSLNLHRIYLSVNANNLRGIKSYENVGFLHEGKMREAVFQNGRYIDLILMGILCSEWQDRDV